MLKSLGNGDGNTAPFPRSKNPSWRAETSCRGIRREGYHRGMQAMLSGRTVRWVAFGAEALAAALSPSTYTAPVRSLAARQLCEAVWAVLPGFVVLCGVLGALVIRIVDATARDFGLAGYSLDLYARLFVMELVPLFVALFVSVRSGAALGTEVALLRVSGALDQGSDPLRAELLPRGIGVAAAVLVLSVVGCLVALAVAYLGLYGLSPWGHGAYARTIGQVFAPVAMTGFALKIAFFAVAVAVVPVAASLGGSRRMASVPNAAPRGLVGVFVLLALAEGVSIAILYA
jgi:phospholipid/cholesterol/gamma-HCH transport system permease protein